MFDAAADDDVSDDEDVDIPVSDDPAADDDSAAAADEDDPTTAADEGASSEEDDPAATDSGGGDPAPADGDDGPAAASVGHGPATAGDEGDAVSVGGLAGSGGEAAGGGGVGGAQLTTQPAAGAGQEAGRALAGAAVPEQGRRRRGGDVAVGGVAERTAGNAEVVDLPDLTDEAELAAALEAILLVVDEPVAEMQLAQILEQPTERVGALLENISARYTGAGHGFDLRRAAGGWRLYTRPEYAAYVERFVLDGQSVRLTQAALETLAVVAYKQPVTRSRISAIRGVNCDGVMRTLATRGLIEECGVEGETGAYLYRTTDLFLEKLGLNSVDQLPPLAPFLPDDVEEVLDAPG
ncbi:SMC-Scp complex subunit ScpB [Paractinoplanes ferrugineus]